MPPWQQLAALLRGQIASGALAPGARLPSLVALSQTYEVALTTVQKTMAALKDENLVVSSPMGYFVRKD